MSQTKRVSGDYTIVATGGTTVDSALTVTLYLLLVGYQDNTQSLQGLSLLFLLHPYLQLYFLIMNIKM